MIIRFFSLCFRPNTSGAHFQKTYGNFRQRDTVDNFIFKGKQERDFEEMILNPKSDVEFRCYLLANHTLIMKWVAAFRAIAVRNHELKKKLEKEARMCLAE